ncbi:MULTISPECIES: hypothetical protein [Mesorhizobium]|uniref:Secreted protein n=3 Tax=Mesorhizobium TaxID=68287 RepID=A0AB38TJS3_9HYPH|nr:MULTISPECIES: hypothetical protein [Mesorhizobium]MDF3216848.1 hypothetical protein [Mesorhizobium ciceri]UTU55201.1 hypothetical protein LRP29_33260 [Mesorhizobium ciceri]
MLEALHSLGFITGGVAAGAIGCSGNPLALWQPWLAWVGQRSGARAHVCATPVVEVEGVKVAPLIFYEQPIDRRPCHPRGGPREPGHLCSVSIQPN